MVNCKTYADRLFGCSYYKEEDNYAKTLRLLIHSTIIQYKDSSDVDITDNFFNILSDKISKRSFNGKRLVYSEDKEAFEDACIKCAQNLNTFVHNNPVKILDQYTYRSRVRGYIGCQIQNDGTWYNVDFSIYNSKDTFYRLYYHRFNNYLYNVVHGTVNDMLVYVVLTGNYYLLKYDPLDYTIQRGMLTQGIKRRTKRPGHQCLTCSVSECKPRLINNLARI